MSVVGWFLAGFVALLALAFVVAFLAFVAEAINEADELFGAHGGAWNDTREHGHAGRG